MIGFKAPAHFTRACKARFGAPPKEYPMKLRLESEEK